MLRTLLFACIGYLCGSLLFAQYFGRLFKRTNIAESSPDQNPGAFNAFKYGGFLCGTLTLCCDLLKGFLPVFIYRHGGALSASDPGQAFVLSAPVCGHILPVFHKFKGGKGIAVFFGCLLGLFPNMLPLLILAGIFVFFSLIINVKPNLQKTFLVYLVSAIIMIPVIPNPTITVGFTITAAFIMIKLWFSPERKSVYKLEVKPVWKR